jgi:hypothetical protein
MGSRGAKGARSSVYRRQVTSSSPETSMHTSGAYRAPHRAPRLAAPRPPARYEPYLDGLFTYCLSVLCDHDAAMRVLGEVLAISERQYGRSPTGEVERKAWLYSLARWACLRGLADQRAGRSAARRRGGAGTPAGGAAAQSPASGSAAAYGMSVAPAAQDAMGSPESAASPAHAGCPASPDSPVRSVPSVSPASQGSPPSAFGPASRSARTFPQAQASAGSGATGPAGPGSAERRRRELALLAWPEAAGTTPEQREVLELAVRHQLGPKGVAAVLSMEPAAARDLLSTAAVEVERTRAALAVVETGACPSVARLTGDSEVLLSATLRRELVRHVDDCPRCRRTAERVEAAGPWPGASARAGRRAPAILPLVGVDRAAAYAAMLHAPTTRGNGPRFGRNGFPLDPKDRAARRDRLRSRAVTTTVVATVIAAPVLARWAAYRGAPDTGEGRGGPSISAGEPGGVSEHDGRGTDRYENAGNASDRPAGPRADGGHGGHGAEGSDVSVTVVSHGAGRTAGGAGTAATGAFGVTAETSSGRTTITLTASGAPVRWAARVGASWISLSRTSGTLAPGHSVTLYVTVDHAREPAGAWSVRIALHPTGAVVLVDGYGYVRSGGPGGSGGAGGSGGRGGHGGHHGHHGQGDGGGSGTGGPGGTGSSGTPSSPGGNGGNGGPSSGGSPSGSGTPPGGSGGTAGTGGTGGTGATGGTGGTGGTEDGGGTGSGGTGGTGTTPPSSGGTTPDPPATPPPTTADPGTAAPSAT